MSKWRNKYEVHPSADVFPMLSDEELRDLGEDIAKHGLQQPLIFKCESGGRRVLLDGRNRLEAMERLGLHLPTAGQTLPRDTDAVSVIISANVHRRHLTKLMRAEMILKACDAAEGHLANDGEVPLSPRHIKGKPGSAPDEVKAKAVATAKEHGISKRTVERALHDYEQPTLHPNAPPKLRAKARRKRKRETLQHYHQLLSSLPRTVEGARRFYLEVVAHVGADPQVEMTAVVDGLQRLADRLAKPNGRAEANA
jgi:ParB-like chromosome segregation protein Spo0J